MKLQKMILTASLLMAAGLTSIASAHTVSGTLTKNPATDKYNVTCSNDGNGVPVKLYMRVKDLTAAAPLISVSATKSTSSSLVSTDPTGGDANYSNPVVFTPTAPISGAGTYILSVSKATGVAGTQTYTAEFHCQTSTNVHTGTASALTQNQ